MNKKELISHLRSFNFPKEILEAFEKVDREKFISQNLKKYAYEDIALPLGNDSTISQPFTIAFMLNLLELKRNQKVLEIGSGSGYVLALISKIIGKKGKLIGIEIEKELYKRSKEILKNHKNIQIFCKNGKDGLPEQAPFDRILISASCKKEPSHLSSQLNNSGIILSSVKQSIVKIKKQGNQVETHEFPGFVFVPLRE